MTKRKRLDFRQSPATPLVVLAGIPHPICGRVATLIEQKVGPATRVIFQASGPDSKRLYPAPLVDALIKAVTGFAIRQSSVPAPQHILLAYIPSDDEEKLLAAFDFYAFPIRLSRLSEYNKGRQYRHDQVTCGQYTIESIAAITPQFMEVKRRLSSPSDMEPLFLPPNNFKVSTSERIADKFRGIRSLKQDWSDQMDSIRRVEVTQSELPKHVRTGVRKTVLADARGLLFPHDPSEHSIPRQLDESSTNLEKQSLSLMRTLFRFGVPLRRGYHHDVQFPGGKLIREQFECQDKGKIFLSSSHANVYPNDYIRSGD